MQYNTAAAISSTARAAAVGFLRVRKQRFPYPYSFKTIFTAVLSSKKGILELMVKS